MRGQSFVGWLLLGLKRRKQAVLLLSAMASLFIVGASLMVLSMRVSDNEPESGQVITTRNDNSRTVPKTKPAQQPVPVVDTAVQKFMANYNIPGVQVAVTKDDKLVYAKSYGTVGMKDPTLVTNQNLFRIASLSKPITSVGIMKLLEAKKLALDTKVFGPGSILGADYPDAPQATHTITVAHLLQHTTGVWANDAKDPMFQRPEYSQRQLINWTLANYPANRNRGNYAYSNFGYSLLGRVIEKLSGKTYEAYIYDSVFRPAGIRDMRIAGNTLADRKSNEVLYTGQSASDDPYGMNVTRMDSHGGWLATATDMARFMVRVNGSNERSDILQPNTISVMTTPPPGGSYAAGWQVNNNNNWWHTGVLPGSSTQMIRTSSGFTMTILCNARSNKAGFTSALDDLLWPAVRDKNTPWQNIDQF